MNDAPDAVDDALGSTLGEREEFPMHDECVATLTMKCGSPQLAVRKKLHEDITVPFIPEEGFAVFQTKIERHFTKLGPIYVQEKRAIYIKPNSNATQSKYLMLTKENFESVLRMRWKIAKSMKTELKYEVFCYFIDTTSKRDKRRRLMQEEQQAKHFPPDNTGLLVDAQANAAVLGSIGVPGEQQHSFLSFNSLSQAMQGYAEVAASLVESAGSRKATIPSLRQPPLFGADAGIGERPRKIARANRQANNGVHPAAPSVSDIFDEPFFVPIPFRINGVDVPIEIDIAALRRSLMLLPPARVQTAQTQSPTPPCSEPQDPPAPARR